MCVCISLIIVLFKNYLCTYQVRDLIEKVETLRVKRMQDKEKMKDFEKTKLQVEQLLEFKAKIMESQVSTYFNTRFLFKTLKFLNFEKIPFCFFN